MRAVVPAGTRWARRRPGSRRGTSTARLIGPLAGGALFGVHEALPFTAQFLGLFLSHPVRGARTDPFGGQDQGRASAGPTGCRSSSSRSERALLLMSGKYMARTGAGKFITLYPPDETVFLRVLDELTRALTGRRGPYILSDLRIGDAPVYVRYGAFVSRWCLDEHGERVLALRHPSGELVPDERGVVFRVPPWVTVPDALRPHLAARAAAADAGFPYVVSKALQFSNAGGIYLARHRETGHRVVLREARPHSGLDEAGDDAVTRLHREHRALTALAGLDCVPEVYGVRTVWEHHFLIEEHIEGTTLLEEIVGRFALLHTSGTDAELALYTDWVASVTERLTEALAAVHARGLRFGDLHPSNIIIRPDGRVALIDFEYATDLDDRDSPVAGAVQPPPGTAGAEADDYALWATWLYMLMPIMEMAGHDRAKALTLERWARRRYGLDAGAGPRRPAALRAAESAAGHEEETAALLDGPEPDWAGLRDRLVRGIHAGATPERTDRLFPGDPEVFSTGGSDVAHGAAGVLLALHRTGAPVPPAWTDWLADTARRRDPAAPGGLYGGLPGTAVVLSALGRREEGRELYERSAAAPPPASTDLLSGRAGIALAALRLARPDRAEDGPPDAKIDHDLLDAAARTAHDLDRLVRGASVPGLRAPASAGLLRGLSGRGPAPPRTARPDRRRPVPRGGGQGAGGGGGPLRDHAGRHRPGEGRAAALPLPGPGERRLRPGGRGLSGPSRRPGARRSAARRGPGLLLRIRP
ncbi:hypothetical protein SCALM49S_01690 [Streptomyces californicus]